MPAIAKKKDKCQCGNPKLVNSLECATCYRKGPIIGAAQPIDRAWDKAISAKYLSMPMRVAV
jgi:hypothetical protein